MAEYIDREAAIKAIYESDHFSVRECFGWRAMEIEEELRAIPAVDVAPVLHGRWERTVDGAVLCTACKRKMNSSQNGYAFCSLCGAKMDGDVD